MFTDTFDKAIEETKVMEIGNTNTIRNSSASLTNEKVDKKVMDIAIKLEATFLSEMLKSAGIGETPSSFGGGAGEDQFGSFLRDAQALEIAKSGGIGLAEGLYKSMKSFGND